MADLSYAVVIATKNRIDALELSIPLALEQTRPAARIVVVDKSDDHAAVAALCDRLGRISSIPIMCVEAPQANSAHQRNVGLDLIVEDVVMFPDDDAFWYSNTAEEVMAVYEADPVGAVGAVSTTQTDVSPVKPSTEIGIAQARLTNVPWIMKVRNALEAYLVPQPFVVYGNERTRELAPSLRDAGFAYPLIPSLGGFRMSFRAEVAKRLRFDDVLGSRSGYAQHEDRDLAMRVLRAGFLIAAAPKARVFHNVYPAKRANGVTYGFFQIFNYLYSCRKALPPESRAARALKRYLAYKVRLYGLRTRDVFDREIYRGARAALAEYDFMMATSDEALADAYAEACARTLPPRTPAASLGA
jgi:glycosyltransferase involved in cell wall biosynthesis